VQGHEPAFEDEGAPVAPVALDAAPGVVAVDEEEVDRRGPADSGLGAQIPLEPRAAARGPRDLANGDHPLEAHPESARAVGIDPRDGPVRMHHAPQERGGNTVHDADLNEALPARRVAAETGLLDSAHLGIGGLAPEAIPEPPGGTAGEDHGLTRPP
jgi:hypothetical protein